MPAKNHINKDLILTRITVESNNCWVWTGSRSGRGNHRYGVVCVAGKCIFTHRLAMHLWKGMDLNTKLNVCHTCDNPPCCNPDHLFLGTQYDNMMDSLRKGRHVDNRGTFHGKAKVDEDDILLMHVLHEVGWNYAEISRVFGTSRGHAGDIIKRRIWRHL